MNDRFKFRCWDKINEIWVKNFSIDEQGCVEGYYNPPQAMNRRLVLMQCTGLKDKNGKLIYEGDIVRLYFDNDEIIAVIELDNDESRFYLNTTDYFKDKYVTDYEIVKQEEYEVIGNKFENPELLKECE